MMHHFSCSFASLEPDPLDPVFSFVSGTSVSPRFHLAETLLGRMGWLCVEPNAENSKGTLMTQGLGRDAGPGNSDGSFLIRELSGRQCI